MSAEAPRGTVAGLGRAELGERLGGFVYGTIVVLSVIVTGLRAFPHGLWDVAVLVAVTTVVFWLAHVYAHGIAFSIGHDAHLSLKELDHIGRREASIVGAGVPPEAALVLGATGCSPIRLRPGSRSGSAWSCWARWASCSPGWSTWDQGERRWRSSPTWRSALC